MIFGIYSGPTTLEASDENVAFRSVKRPVQTDRVLEVVCKGLGMGTSGAVSIHRKHFADLRSKDVTLNKQAILIEQELDMEMA